MTDSQPPRLQEETQSTDLDVARDFLAEAYADSSGGADQTRQPFSFRYTAVGDQAMTLRTIRFDGHLDGVMTPSEDFVVQWTHKGRGTITTDSATIGDGARPAALGRSRVPPFIVRRLRPTHRADQPDRARDRRR